MIKYHKQILIGVSLLIFFLLIGSACAVENITNSNSSSQETPTISSDESNVQISSVNSEIDDKLDSSDISDSSLDISGYKFVKLLDRKEKDELGKEINVDFLADNEFIFKFTKDKKEIYVDISIVYGTGLPKIEAKILLEKESD